MAACTISSDDGPCGSCKRIEDINAVIASLEVEENLVVLKAARVAFKIARNASHDRLVARLPLEIVSHIFQVYVDAAFDESNDESDDDDDDDDENLPPPFLFRRMESAPLRLGAICRTWRAIAWTSPRLWIKMSVNVLNGASEIIRELATQWLERTGQLPLTIRLYAADSDFGGPVHLDDTDTEAVIPLIRTICKFSFRWQTLDISLRMSVTDDNTIQTWSPGIIRRNPNLQHLRLKGLSANLTAQLFKNLNEKPSPTYVSLSSVKLDYLDIDWSNATAFHANALTIQESIQLLRTSVNSLRTLHLKFMSVRNQNPMQLLSSPIIIPTLRVLCLSRPCSSTILDGLTLPLLEELRWASDNGTVGSIISLIGRSHCQLTALDIWYPKITDELLLFLQAMPSLRSLSILIQDDLGHGNAERLFKYLATSDGSVHLSNLRKLHFTIYECHTLAWETIPDIFDPSRSFTSHGSTLASPQLQRRSQRLQRRSLRLLLDITGELGEIGHIDMISLHHISELLQLGINISILFREEFCPDEPQDLIATSMKFHCPDESSTDYESESYSYDASSIDYGSGND